jgi:hypothetical protein
MTRKAPPFQGPRYSRRRRPDSKQTATQFHALFCSLALLQVLRARGRGRHGQAVQCLHVRVPPTTERLTSQMQPSMPHRSPHSPYQRPTSPCAGWPTCVRRLVCPKLAGLKCMWNVSDLVSGLPFSQNNARRRAELGPDSRSHVMPETGNLRQRCVMLSFDVHQARREVDSAPVTSRVRRMHALSRFLTIVRAPQRSRPPTTAAGHAYHRWLLSRTAHRRATSAWAPCCT